MGRAKKLQRIIFWCEFPEKVDWNRAESLLNFAGLQIEVYVAVSSKEKYFFW